jgi:hypothetical protein
MKLVGIPESQEDPGSIIFSPWLVPRGAANPPPNKDHIYTYVRTHSLDHIARPWPIGEVSFRRVLYTRVFNKRNIIPGAPLACPTHQYIPLLKQSFFSLSDFKKLTFWCLYIFLFEWILYSWAGYSLIHVNENLKKKYIQEWWKSGTIQRLTLYKLNPLHEVLEPKSS